MKFKMKHLCWAALLWTGCTATDPDVGPDGAQGWPEQPQLPAITGHETFSVAGDEFAVNVMGDMQFGLKPRTAVGSASILFTPTWQVTPGMVPAHRGNWQAVVLRLERI